MISLSVSVDVPNRDDGVRFYSNVFGFSKVAEPVPGVAVLRAGTSKIFLFEKDAGSPSSICTQEKRHYERHWTPFARFRRRVNLNVRKHNPFATMKITLVSIAAFIPLLAFAQVPVTDACPFSPKELTANLGHQFKAGVPEQGILGKACTYEAGSVKLWIDAGPNPAPTAEMYRKMSNPLGTTWKPVAGDPDKAVHTVPKSDVSPFPSLSYERKGWLVNITVTGINSEAEIEAWNAKLAQLKRVP
jgi:hypothetical protein